MLMRGAKMKPYAIKPTTTTCATPETTNESGFCWFFGGTAKIEIGWEVPIQGSDSSPTWLPPTVHGVSLFVSGGGCSHDAFCYVGSMPAQSAGWPRWRAIAAEWKPQHPSGGEGNSPFHNRSCERQPSS